MQLIRPFLSGFPHPLKLRIWRTYRYARWLTGPLRMLPQFLVIGEQKCGTTSIYKYLVQHPQIAPSLEKELRFFDRQFNRGRFWYQASFPFQLYSQYVRKRHGYNLITGDASPNYLCHPRVPQRVKTTLSDIKFIVLLRNPVERAYSHYNMSVRHKKETLSFAEALDNEEERLGGKIGQVRQGDDFESYYQFLHYAYKSRGIYALHLQQWFELFSRERFFIINSADFQTDPAKTLAQTFDFLGLPNWGKIVYDRHNVGNYSALDGRLRQGMEQFFEPYNRQLYDLLERDFGW